jgi:hypothetical protein
MNVTAEPQFTLQLFYELFELLAAVDTDKEFENKLDGILATLLIAWEYTSNFPLNLDNFKLDLLLTVADKGRLDQRTEELITSEFIMRTRLQIRDFKLLKQKHSISSSPISVEKKEEYYYCDFISNFFFKKLRPILKCFKTLRPMSPEMGRLGGKSIQMTSMLRRCFPHI